MPGLSKSRYTTFCQCSKALWLRVYHPELQPEDPNLQARFDAGNEVGDLAMGLFGPFVEVTTHTAEGKLDLKAMIEKTKHEMNGGNEVICEASFSYEGCYCAVDILRREGSGWAIYEVKSSSSHSGDEVLLPDKFDKYAVDIAFQRWVLEQCGVKVTGTYLVTINGDYERVGDLDIHQLFRIINLKERVESEYPLVSARVQLAKQILEQEREPERAIGPHCADPYECGFWQYCAVQQGLTQDEGEPTVFDLYRMKSDKKWEYYNAGKITFEDLRDEPLSDMQQLQVECTLAGAEHIEPEGIRDFLDGLSYPLYFLDFETFQPIIPPFDHVKPYQQVTFQYSLHIIEHEGGKLIHKEFLAPSDGTDPRRLLAERLCQDIPMNVCSLAYNNAFECTRIKELANLYPDLSAHLLNISDHIVDLITPFRARHYYVPAMGGSFSIKSVLPALFPDDPSLDYHNLDERVQNGGDAMTIFPQIQYMDPNEATATREALLRYCELDTLAMVKVWQKLREQSNV